MSNEKEENQENQLLDIFNFNKMEKRIESKIYINDLISAEKIKDIATCLNEILARKHVIKEQESLVPYFFAEINKIKDVTLNQAFMEQFFIPYTVINNSLVNILKSNTLMEQTVDWLEHKYLESQAKLFESGEKWLLHLKAQYILLSLANYDWKSQENTNNLPFIMQLPSNNLDALITFFREKSLNNQTFEIKFKTAEELIEPIKIFQLRCQMKNKNAVFMEKNLSEKKSAIQALQEKTEIVSEALFNELQFLEKKLLTINNDTLNMEKQTNKIQEYLKGKKCKRNGRSSVNNLAKDVLHCKKLNLKTFDIIKLIESRLQSLFDAIFLSMTSGDNQLQMEKEWIEKEKREINNRHSEEKTEIRLKKLERKLEIALSPPSKKSYYKLPAIKLKKMKKCEITKEEKIMPLAMEKSFCFDKDIDINLISKLYQPSSSLLSSNKKDNPLSKSWFAVEQIIPNEQLSILKSRKSRESVLELLETRNSYDFILSNKTANLIRNAERRDKEFIESDDNTSNPSSDSPVNN